MDILQKIKKHKLEEVEHLKKITPVARLQESIHYHAPAVSLSAYIRRPDKSGVITEFKKKSPSEGYIHQYADVERISMGYMQAGSSGLSVLTDQTFFGGRNEDLITARNYNFCPILRKDFTVDAYQIHEAKSIGADAILLIAAILSAEQIREFSGLAKELGLEVLLEIHDKSELEKYADGIELIGVNNRNLKDFSVDIRHSVEIYPDLPDEAVKISESGIRTAEEMIELYRTGFDGFLIGTQFMKTSDPVRACRLLLDEFEEKKRKYEV